MPLDNSRGLSDADLSVNAALPNAGNTVNTAAIDLGSAQPFPVTEKFSVKVSTTAATGANSKNINIVLQDSADGSNFANIEGLGPFMVTDAGGAGFPADSHLFSLPPGTRQHLRASATGEANGGNAADGTLTVDLLF